MVELLVVALFVAAVEILGTASGVAVVPSVSFSFETVVVFLSGTAVDLSAAVAAVFSGSDQSIKQNNKRGMCMILTIFGTTYAGENFSDQSPGQRFES